MPIVLYPFYGLQWELTTTVANTYPSLCLISIGDATAHSQLVVYYSQMNERLALWPVSVCLESMQLKYMALVGFASIS
jgi:hypothetical protein